MIEKVADLLFRIAVWKSILKELQKRQELDKSPNKIEEIQEDDTETKREDFRKIVDNLTETEAREILSRYEADLKEYLSALSPERIASISKKLKEETEKEIPAEYMPSHYPNK